MTEPRENTAAEPFATITTESVAANNTGHDSHETSSGAKRSHDSHYRTIVADPPWHYDTVGPKTRWGPTVGSTIDDPTRPARTLPYRSMSVAEIAAIDVLPKAAHRDSHLFLWTTSRYLRDAFDVVDAWGFRYSKTLVWCKEPQGHGPGGLFASLTEYVLYARRGTPPHKQRIERNWWTFPRAWRDHSRKPDAFQDIVEQVCPGPYLEMFSRRARLGWDTWGDEALHGTEAVA